MFEEKLTPGGTKIDVWETKEEEGKSQNYECIIILNTLRVDCQDFCVFYLNFIQNIKIVSPLPRNLAFSLLSFKEVPC